MKNFSLRGTALALVAVMSVGAAQAATIQGELFIGGQVAPVPGPTLGDAIGLSFVSGLLVTNATGDFAADGLGFGSTGTISDFFFSDTSVDPFIQVGSFTAVLNSVTVVGQSGDFLELLGTGSIRAAGFDDTPITFSLSADGSGSLFAFSATVAIVPIPGALLLFASGLAALGLRRRS